MAIIDDRTGGRDYALPNAANKLKDDVVRLRSASSAVDADVVALQGALAGKSDAGHTHTISGVSGLQTALDGKQDAGTFGAFDDLSDVSVADAANGQVPIKQGASWIPIALQVGNVTNLETLLNGKAAAADVAAKADGAATTAALALKAPLASPALTGTPTAPTATAGTDTTQVATTSFLQAAIAALKGGVASTYDTLAKLATAILGRALKIDTTPNLFVNGSLIDDQEHTYALGTTNGYYAADQWAMFITASGAAVSVQNIALDNDDGGDRAIELKVTTAKASLGASDLWTLTQNIEGARPQFKAAKFGTAGAKPFVLRLRFWAPAAGDYSWHFANQANNRHMWMPFTISGGEAGTLVEKIVTVPGDTGGTWLKGVGQLGMTCDLVLAKGATLTGGTAGAWSSSAFYGGAGQANGLAAVQTFRAAELGLRLDPDATGVYGAYEAGEVDAVYRSERYAEPVSNLGVRGQVLTASDAILGVTYSRKAKTPTISRIASTFSAISGTSTYTSTGALDGGSTVAGVSGSYVRLTGFSGLPSNLPVLGNGTNDFLLVLARLS